MPTEHLAKISCLAAIQGTGLAYTAPFLLLFRTKFLRNLATSRGTEAWLTIEVVLGTVTAVLTLTAFTLLFFSRPLAGRFFFLATIVGTLLLVWSTAGIVAPFRPPIGLDAYAWNGLWVGNLILAASVILAFFVDIPSLA